MRAGLLTLALAALATLGACSGTPALPGTATCEVGRSQRTVRCDEVCGSAASARSETERDEWKRCAQDECATTCE